MTIQRIQQRTLEYDPAPERVVALVNPASGIGTGQRVIDVLRQRHWPADVTVFATSPDLTGHRAALDYARATYADRLIVAGGDGTLMETLTEMLSTGPAIPICMLPIGTGNIVANDLDMPRRILPALRQAFRTGWRRWWDIGHLEPSGQFFALRASTGHEAATLANMDPATKKRLGTLAYAMPAVRELIKAEPVTFTLTIDDLPPVQLQGITAFVAATSRMVNWVDFVLSRDIAPDDGVLHAGVVHPQKLLANLPHMVGSAALEARDIVTTFPVKHRVRIDADPPQRCQVDGECLEQNTPLVVNNYPGKAAFITPLRMRKR
ncbi:MAG: diacylglycerol/lipid kinase family protein [Anaerolineales bacterium]